MTRSIGETRRLPYIFLDVDGVLNAFAYESGLFGFGDFERHEVAVNEGLGTPSRYFEVWLSRAMGGRLAALEADIRWLTTWEHHADTQIAPLCDLPRGLLVVTSDEMSRRVGPEWKFPALRRTVEEDLRPFVWVDDDLDLLVDAGISPREWAESLNVKTLLISPDPRTGLTPAELETIAVFVGETS